MKSNEWIQVHLKWNNKSNSNITFNFTIDFDFVWSIPYDRSIRICIQLETTYLSDIEIAKKSRIEHNTTHSIYRNRCLKPTGLHQSSSPKIFNKQMYQVFGFSFNLTPFMRFKHILRSLSLENFTGCKWGQTFRSGILPWLQSFITFASKQFIINGTAFSKNT